MQIAGRGAFVVSLSDLSWEQYRAPAQAVWNGAARVACARGAAFVSSRCYDESVQELLQTQPRSLAGSLAAGAEMLNYRSTKI
jgi:hypothetical protein